MLQRQGFREYFAFYLLIRNERANVGRRFLESIHSLIQLIGGMRWHVASEPSPDVRRQRTLSEVLTGDLTSGELGLNRTNCVRSLKVLVCSRAGLRVEI